MAVDAPWSRTLSRVGWFVALWLAGVLGVASVAGLLRWWLIG